MDNLLEKAHELMKKVSNLDKKNILKYIDLYKYIMIIDYKTIEESFYSNYNIIDKKDKILFEISRLNKHVSSNEDIKTLDYINKNIQFISKMPTSFAKNQKIIQIINDIIEFELSKDMPIYLYEEFIEYFKEKLSEYDASYQKKRD